MTDNELIKALECCSDTANKSCKEKKCPAIKECMTDVDILEKSALYLINRQKAEIERKTTECERLEIYMDELVKQKLKQAKSEAYREFAERLKNLTASYWLDNINVGHINDIAKELTEGK